MSELSGLELRKKVFVDVFGWRFEDYYNGGGFWHKEGCKERQRSSRCKCGGQHYLPAVESDPAVSEPMFLEWCEKEDANFILADYFADAMQTKRKYEIEMHFKDGRHHFAQGSTPSEARARAIVASRKEEGV